MRGLCTFQVLFIVFIAYNIGIVLLCCYFINSYYIIILILYPCRTLCPIVIRASLSPIFQYFSLYYSNNHVTGACTRHVPWIQAAMDSDSSAREAALHKRRERD